MRWKRALLSVPAVTGLFFLSAGDLDRFSIGEKSMAAIAAVLRDPLSILAQRSPGERSGALLQTKKQRRGVASGPSERVLSTMRERPPVVSLAELPDLLGTLPLADEPLFTDAENLLDAIPGSGSGLGPGNPFSGGPVWPPSFSVPVTGGDGGGGGPGPGPSPSPSPEPTPVPPAVPEPATWLTMIIGFFAAGMALRRHDRSAPRRHAGSIRSR